MRFDDVIEATDASVASRRAQHARDLEAERMRDRPFMRQALATGKVLYESARA